MTFKKKTDKESVKKTASKTLDEQAHGNKARPKRVPFSGGHKLHVPEHLKEEGYFYYYAVDRSGMIEQLEAAWYERVKGDNGEDITACAGGGETHYLMRIPEQYHDEDMARQQKLNIDSTRKNVQELGDNEYVPAGHKNVVEREII